MIYHFAIDETGDFTLLESDKSFVCGVLVLKNEYELKQKYQEAFKKCGFGEKVPTDIKGLIGEEKFHFNKMSDSNREICREILLPLVDKIFVSKGKPLLLANNQNFWQIAVVSVIIELFKKHKFQKYDKLEIEIDYRADKVWGLFVENEGDKLGFKDYHEILKRQIDESIKPYHNNLGVEIKLKFVGDTNSFFVNLADIVCGFSRKTDIKKIECDCKIFMNGNDSVSLLDKNPIGGLILIFQEVLNEQFQNIYLVENVFKKTKSTCENYNMVWDVFHNFLRYHIKTRYDSKNIMSKLDNIVEIFLKEFLNNTDKLTVDKRLEIINTFMSYYSHIGAIETPVDKDCFIKSLNETGKNAECRVVRKWEKYISFCLKEAQIQFNGYNFKEVISNFEKIWEIQEKILKLDYPFDSKKDENTAAILGTLAQSYAFDEKIDDAIEYLELSKNYAVKTSAQTDSYLLTLYFIKEDVEKVRHFFESQTGEDVWKKLSYSKLRALELYKNKKTGLPEISIDDCDSEYPYPLVLKWAAVAKHIENPAGNKQIISKYLSKAIENLLKNECKFTIKTLSLPIIQIFALVDNSNPYHAKYNLILEELKKQSANFAEFIEKKQPLLNSIKNKADIWQRANFLPFHYS